MCDIDYTLYYMESVYILYTWNLDIVYTWNVNYIDIHMQYELHTHGKNLYIYISKYIVHIHMEYTLLVAMRKEYGI